MIPAFEHPLVTAVGRRIDALNAEHDAAWQALLDDAQAMCREGWTKDAAIGFVRRAEALMDSRIAAQMTVLERTAAPFAITPEARAMVRARLADARALLFAKKATILGDVVERVERETADAEALEVEFNRWMADALKETATWH